MAATDIETYLCQHVRSSFKTSEEIEKSLSFVQNILGGNYETCSTFEDVIQLFFREGRIKKLDKDFNILQNLPVSEQTKANFQGLLSDFFHEEGGQFSGLPAKITPEKLIGRESDLEELNRQLLNEDAIGSLIAGPSGTGKSRLASVPFETWLGNKIPVDLRGTTAVNNLCKELTFRLGKLSMTEGSLSELEQTISSLPQRSEAEKTLIWLDNSEHFMQSEQYPEFLELLKMFANKGDSKIKVLLTSKIQMTIDDLSISRLQLLNLKPLNKSLSDSFLSDNSRSQLTRDGKGFLADFCKGSPLNLNLLLNFLQDRGSSGEEIIGILREMIIPEMESFDMSPKEGTEQEEKELEETLSPLTETILNCTFDRMSRTLQESSVILTLFLQTFPHDAAASVLGRSSDESYFIMDALRYCRLVTAREETVQGKLTRVYDVHPAVNRFLLSKVQTNRTFETILAEAEGRFLTYYSDHLTKIGYRVDKDFLEVYKLFSDEKPHFEKALTISSKLRIFPFEGPYSEYAQVNVIFENMINLDQRNEMLMAWIEAAELQGNDLCYSK